MRNNILGRNALEIHAYELPQFHATVLVLSYYDSFFFFLNLLRRLKEYVPVRPSSSRLIVRIYKTNNRTAIRSILLFYGRKNVWKNE